MNVAELYVKHLQHESCEKNATRTATNPEDSRQHQYESVHPYLALARRIYSSVGQEDSLLGFQEPKTCSVSSHREGTARDALLRPHFSFSFNTVHEFIIGCTRRAVVFPFLWFTGNISPLLLCHSSTPWTRLKSCRTFCRDRVCNSSAIFLSFLPFLACHLQWRPVAGTVQL